MDILYILGTGSTWQNNEIRYSLRSVAENVKNFGKVFIVGELPSFLKNVIHIPCGDLYRPAWKNAYAKTRLACEDPRLSDDFFFMNDDFFIVKPVDPASYPYYCNSNGLKVNYPNHACLSAIQKKCASPPWSRVLNIFNFGVHRPLRYNKKLYLEMPIVTPNSLAFSPRSFYCNYYFVPGIPCVDSLLYPVVPEKAIDSFSAGLTDFSIASATGRSPAFQNWIQKRFPKPSPFEK